MSLCLKRKLGEKVVITDTTSDGQSDWRIVEITSTSVKLSFQAPLKFEVDRLEVYWDKQAARAEAAATA